MSGVGSGRHGHRDPGQFGEDHLGGVQAGGARQGGEQHGAKANDDDEEDVVLRKQRSWGEEDENTQKEPSA